MNNTVGWIRLGGSFLLLLLVSAAVFAQTSQQDIKLNAYHHFALRVSDLDRSERFYSDLFGVEPARVANNAVFALGDDSQHFTLMPLGPGEVPGIAWIGLSVENFDIDALEAYFLSRGYSSSEALAVGGDALERARHFWLTEVAGETAFFFADAEGIAYRLMSIDDCGSCGRAKNAAGIFSAQGINHFTNFVANSARSNAQMQALFGLGILAYQGPTSPTLSIGDGLQFLMYVGGRDEAPPSTAGRTDHVSLSVTGFDVEAMRRQLTEYGLRAVEGQRPPKPLTHWVSLRMPNRGGAEGGTPELYFADPDGIAIQVQDPSYCGGGGYLGDQCKELN